MMGSNSPRRRSLDANPRLQTLEADEGRRAGDGHDEALTLTHRTRAQGSRETRQSLEAEGDHLGPRALRRQMIAPAITCTQFHLLLNPNNWLRWLCLDQRLERSMHMTRKLVELQYQILLPRTAWCIGDEGRDSLFGKTP